MSDVEGKALQRLKLRLGIKTYLLRRGGSHYAGQVRGNFYWASDGLFDSVIAELVAECILTQTTGRDGGAKLVLAQNAQEETHGG